MLKSKSTKLPYMTRWENGFSLEMDQDQWYKMASYVSKPYINTFIIAPMVHGSFLTGLLCQEPTYYASEVVVRRTHSTIFGGPA